MRPWKNRWRSRPNAEFSRQRILHESVLNVTCPNAHKVAPYDMGVEYVIIQIHYLGGQYT